MNARQGDLARVVLNAVVIPVAIAINFWPGMNVGQVSRETEPLIAAAGWTFAIWGLIFLGQLAYTVFQALPKHREDPTLRRIGPFTALAAVGMGAWPLLFTHHLFTAAWLVIVGTLAALVAVEVRMHGAQLKGAKWWTVRLPWALNLGWVSVAVLLNTAQWLVTVVKWDGGPLSPLAWSMVLVGLAFVLAAVMGWVRKNVGFVAAAAWGLAGIAAEKRLDAPMLSMAAGVACAALIILAIARVIASKTRVDTSTYVPSP